MKKKIIIGLLSLVLMLGMVRPALGYSFTDTQDVNDGTVGQLVVDVAEDGDWMVWTFDFPVELFTGEGNLNVGLIIATDGEGNGPAFQIHNNDGADATYPWGTWLWSPWGPTTGDGWMGWHSGDTNTPVTDVSLDWVEAIGHRNTPWQGFASGDGVMEIRIKKSVLGESFHWAASPTVGAGFFAPAYDITMQIPVGFGWGTPLVNMAVPNYVYVPPPPDTTAPVVDISSPADSALLSGLVDIVGSVTDDVKLSHYNLSLYPDTTDLSDGGTHSVDRIYADWCSGTVSLSLDFVGDFCTDWDTTNYADGEYQIRLAARDAAGNRDTSNYDTGNTSSVHVIGISIDNTAPVVEITSHNDGDLVQGTVEVRGSVNDANPDHYYVVLRDSSNHFVTGPGTVSRTDSFNDEVLFSFDSTSLVEGDTYTIWLAARDAAGNRDDSAGSLATVDVVIDNDSDGDGYAFDVDCDDSIPELTDPTFKNCILYKSGVEGNGILKAPGLQKPFNPNSKAADNAGKKDK